MGTLSRFVIQREDGAEFEILSGFGCGLNGWRVPNGKGGLEELLFGYTDEPTLRAISNDTNAGCRLSPFPGRTCNAKFTWNGKTYQLENNVTWAPHALHGFLQNKCWQFESFEIVETEIDGKRQQGASATFTCDFPGAYAGFPFPFLATNTVFFTGESYKVVSSVKNYGSSPMPYSEGFHPYYTLGEKVDGLTMELPESKLALCDSADIPTGNFKQDTRFVGGRKIDDEFINDCFCIHMNGLAHVYLSSSTKKLDIWQQAGNEQYNAIQIYTPPTRENIAIEPMTAEPDALNHHRGLIVIEPGKTKTFQFGATFSCM